MTTDQAIRENRQLASTGNAVTPQLASCLNSPTLSRRGAAEKIAAVPALLAEAKALAPAAIAKALAPANRTGVMNAIGPRLTIFPQGDFSDVEWAAWWDAYVAALGDLPAASIEAGIVEWMKQPDAKFMPKPGELRALAVVAETADARRADILQRALAHHARPRVIRNEKHAVAQMARELVHALGARNS